MSPKANVFAINDPNQIPINALRPRIITAARANPAAGNIGEIASDEDCN